MITGLPSKVMAHLRGLREQRKLHYRSWFGKLWIDWTTPRPFWQEIRMEDLRGTGKGKTIFLLGSGPSLNDVTPEQWAHIGRHASFGINYSVLKDFVPTYHIMEDSKRPDLREHFVKCMASRRARSASSVWFISNRHVERLIHPKYAPEMFPDPPKVCIFQQPGRVKLDRDRPFEARDFASGLTFRGTLSVVLDLVLQMGFTTIVLLGIDLHTSAHFFDELAEMKYYLDYQLSVGRLPVFESMIPKENQYRTQDEYLVALHELLLKPEGRQLMMGARDQTIHPRLPLYGWPG